MIKLYTENKIVEIARYIIKNQDTIRNTASVFKLSKSTIHKYMTKLLRDIDYRLFIEVRKVLNFNASVRHIRGGDATRKVMKERRK